MKNTKSLTKRLKPTDAIKLEISKPDKSKKYQKKTY